MRRLIGVLVGAMALLVSATGIHAQDLLVPAGTLLQCTMEEPNFSSATAAIGDPVLCHLRTMQEFGRPMFPRGSMLGGHLEADKEPGHFFGKGNMKITFDRVILPNGDLPVPTKIIQARGYKVDKEGDIDGKGHAKRDVVEWMIPPLWPWKVVSLPMRGPRPTLKGEEPLELRLMDDIVIPRSVAQYRPERPPYATGVRPSTYRPTPQSTYQPRVVQIANARVVDSTNATVANTFVAHTDTANLASAENTEPSSDRFTVLVLKSNDTIQVVKYHRDRELLMFQDVQGRKGSVNLDNIDWRKTTEVTSAARTEEQPPLSRQLN
jgi:hypothetical protein